jgi:hypothetical protein
VIPKKASNESKEKIRLYDVMRANKELGFLMLFVDNCIECTIDMSSGVWGLGIGHVIDLCMRDTSVTIGM